MKLPVRPALPALLMKKLTACAIVGAASGAHWTKNAGADGGTRTRTGIPKRILSPLRLPFRHVRKREAEVHVAEGTGIGN